MVSAETHMQRTTRLRLIELKDVAAAAHETEHSNS